MTFTAIPSFDVKQGEAITIPVYAITTATGEGATGLVDANFTVKRISKGGGAFGAMTVTITEMENGLYSLPLSASHTDTLGVLTVALGTATTRPTIVQVRVMENISDDIAALMDNAQTSLNSIDSRLPAALVGGRMDSSVGAYASGAITAAAFAANAITSTAVDASVWAAATVNLATAQANKLDDLWTLAGLNAAQPLVVTAATRDADAISQTIVEAPAGVITVTRI